MQGQFHHITGREGVLRQGREEQFVDHAFSCDANGTLLFPGGVRRHNHAGGRALGSSRNLWAIGEAARPLTFGTLLELVGREVQTGLDQRMIEQVIIFAASDKREASSIGEHRSIAIVPIEPE